MGTPPVTAGGNHILILRPCLLSSLKEKEPAIKANSQSQRFWRRDGANLLSGGRLLARKQSPPAAGGDTAQTCFPVAVSLQGSRAPPLLEETQPKPDCSKHPPSMRCHKYVSKTHLEV